MSRSLSKLAQATTGWTRSEISLGHCGRFDTRPCRQQRSHHWRPSPILQTYQGRVRRDGCGRYLTCRELHCRRCKYHFPDVRHFFAHRRVAVDADAGQGVRRDGAGAVARRRDARARQHDGTDTCRTGRAARDPDRGAGGPFARVRRVEERREALLAGCRSSRRLVRGPPSRIPYCRSTLRRCVGFTAAGECRRPGGRARLGHRRGVDGAARATRRTHTQLARGGT